MEPASIKIASSRSALLLGVCLLALASAPAHAATVTIAPAGDNTIADGVDPGTGEDFRDNSSGACEDVFSGTTADGFTRRALLRFDIAGSIPPGATINSVTLTLTVNKSPDTQDATMTLHPVSRSWGEGTNDCGPKGGGQGLDAVTGSGDATWTHAEFDSVTWTGSGGDFGDASASAPVGFDNGSQGVWSSTTMAGEVQAWLDNPTTNYGWILVGDEARSPTARRFSSREGTVPPTLEIDFDCVGCIACCFNDGVCSVELSNLSCTGVGGTPLDPPSDTCEPNLCPQPFGACCNADESCSETVNRLVCLNAGGSFQGENVLCSDAIVDCGLTPFVDALPIPPALAPTGTRADGVLQYTVEVVDAQQQLHSELPATDLWTYNGAYPSFTIEATVGDRSRSPGSTTCPRRRGSAAATCSKWTSARTAPTTTRTPRASPRTCTAATCRPASTASRS